MGNSKYYRRIAASAAFILTFAALAPAAAHAASSATPRTYYVGGGFWQTCSDSGPGTAALPLCTIQQAASLATVPGDVVSVSPSGSHSGEVDITASGTASAPIVFETGPAAGYGEPGGTDGGDQVEYGFNITGSSYIDISGFTISQTTSSSLLRIADSSHITADGLNLYTFDATDVPSVSVTDSSAVTLSRDQIGTTQDGTGITIDGGSGNVVTTDVVYGPGPGVGIAVQGSTDPVVTSNTVYDYCGSGISLSDTSSAASSGAVIENNVVAFPATETSPDPNLPCSATSSAAISLASAADTGNVTENYNAVYPNAVAGAAEYSWAGTAYSSPAALYAVTGQGSADLDSNPDISSLNGPNGQIQSGGSPLISSANSNAPGELATDLDRATRSCAPSVTPTGVGSSPCYDRGAYQYTDTVTDTGISFPPTSAPTGAALTFGAGTPSSDWSGATFEYTYVFGDGTSLTTSAASATHVYASPAEYWMSVTAVSSLGGTYTKHLSIWVTTPEPLTCSTAMTTTSGLSAEAAVSATSAWTITAASVNWGDGTSSTLNPAIDDWYANHTYAKAGTYTVTCSAADAGSDQASATTQYSTGDDYTPYGPTRLLDTRSGTGGTSAELANDGSIKLQVAGVGTIPTDVRAVVLNLTALDATGAGYIQANTGTNTGTSTLNYGSGGIYSNSVIAPVAADGTVTLSSHATSTSTKLDLLADISGYFAPESASGYTPLDPARIMDTATGIGGSSGALAAGGTDVLTVAGADGGTLPSGGITAVSVNLTITGTSKLGYLSAYPDGGPTPAVSAENWSGGATRAIAAIVPVGTDGKIDLHNGSDDGGMTQVIVDVTGYFTASGPGMYVPVTPQRIFDTRTLGGGVAPGQFFPYDFTTNPATDTTVPAAATAYAMNTTVTETTGSGWLAVLPQGVAPSTSSLNWIGANQTVANLTIAPNTASGAIDFHNGGSTTDDIQVLADLSGYFIPA